MNKNYSQIKQLYTLNDSKLSSDEEISENNSSLGEQQIEGAGDMQELQRQNRKLIRKNEQLRRMIGDLQLKNQEVHELNQLSEKRNNKHQEKQRDLIKKLSYFQVSNKQMAYQIRKMSQDMAETRENKKVSEGQINQMKQVIKKSLYEKDKFLCFLKTVLQMLKRCDKPEEYQIQKDKIIQFVNKNISNSESQSKINCQFDLKFELSRVDTLKQKIKSLQKQLQTAQQALEKEKLQRKKTVTLYNDKINKLREMYDSLRQKVDMQQDQSRRKIKNILNQKNDIIEGLKTKLKESRIRKSSVDVKKSRQSRKSFIGDGDYSHLQLNELNEAIQNLQMQIIKEFEE